MAGLPLRGVNPRDIGRPEGRKPGKKGLPYATVVTVIWGAEGQQLTREFSVLRMFAKVVVLGEYGHAVCLDVLHGPP